MKIKIGVNGMGRIGRMIVRSIIDRTIILPILPIPFIPILIFIIFL